MVIFHSDVLNAVASLLCSLNDFGEDHGVIDYYIEGVIHLRVDGKTVALVKSDEDAHWHMKPLEEVPHDH
jgi:hypothetical protein